MPDPSFLGTGWSFPPTFTRAGHTVLTASDDADIKQSLRVLFGTAPGERIMLAEYGCSLWRLVFGALTATLITQIGDAVRMAVLRWEPRIDVDAVEVSAAPGSDGLVAVNVAYTIRTTNARSNLVYPFYLREGTLVPAAVEAADPLSA
ncbi:MAG TPA: GPW/gp25 family protein [Longimicrobium sp.]|nr:GPW/gp25 family protein [Longimicrobium sp.]